EKKTMTVRLARAAGEADSEVAAVSSKSKGEAASKEELLGISVEPLTQDDARDVRLRSVLERGGGLVVTDVSPDGPAYGPGRLQASDDPGGPDIIIAVNGVPTRPRTRRQAAGAEPAGQHLPVGHAPAEQTGRQPEREPGHALGRERERMDHVEQKHRSRGGHAGVGYRETVRQRRPRTAHERHGHR